MTTTDHPLILADTGDHDPTRPYRVITPGGTSTDHATSGEAAIALIDGDNASGSALYTWQPCEGGHWHRHSVYTATDPAGR
ncbi:MAG TPA: hypothetical protein VH092_23560 [Urbifossiella sp.]|jgi:hypothetical protein|nr:hypothetical protein [Urbifossiella sp.]